MNAVVVGYTGKRLAASILLAGYIFATAAGCAAKPDDVDPVPGWVRDGEYQDWDALRPAIKEYLLSHPSDPVGHYLYGLSFLHLQQPQLTYAEGEFLTALQLLQNVEGFPEERVGMSRNAFAGKLHRKTALAYMRGYREAVGMGLPPRYCKELLKKAYAQVENGLSADPDSANLKEYKQFLRGALEMDSPSAPEVITERAGQGLNI